MEFQFDYNPNGCDELQPLIYAWYVGEHIYVGKSEKGASRPLKHYRRNIERYLAGKPYRASNPDGWRTIHLAMIQAVETGTPIRLELVENVPASKDIYSVETEWRNRLGADLNG